MSKAVLAFGVVALALLAAMWLLRAGGRGPGTVAEGRDEGRAEEETPGAARPAAEGRRSPASLDAGSDPAEMADEGAAVSDASEGQQIQLRVRDRISGRELAPVLVADVQGRDDSELVHPGAAGEDAANLGPSPVRLPPAEGESPRARVLRVRSPGFGWARIELDLEHDQKHGSERILLLDPAGELEIALAGAVPTTPTRLVLRGGSETPFFEQELVLGVDSLVVEALVAGRYRVTVESGDENDPQRLGEARADVVAGRRAQLRLVLRASGSRSEATSDDTDARKP